jgi:multidrug efflux pump subunit AcrA (membrane-fusion protein)
VAADQFVMPGDPLWTISDWSKLWLRVPVFESDLPRIRREESAMMTIPGTHSALSAEPVALPVSTKPGLRTIDLYYSVTNSAWNLRDGQSLTVRLPTDEQAEEILVPPSAVLWDGLGNGWVYLRRGPETFRRQRVELGAAQADGVVVTRGLQPGDEVVVTGTAALYGEEFKGTTPAADADD